MAAAVAHFVAMEVIEIATVVEMLLMARIGAMVSVPPVEPVVYVAIEVMGTMEPRAGADKHAIREPFRAVVAVRSALIRRIVIVAIRTDRSRTDLNTERNLGLARYRCAKSQGSCGDRWYKNIPLAHKFTSSQLEGCRHLSVVPVAPR